MKLRTLAALVLLTLAAPLAAQTVTVEVAPGQLQGFAIAGPATISYNADQVVITLGATPGPGPTPAPTPTPPLPDPTPPPAPVATGKLWVTYVWDGQAETQEQATTRADLATAPEWQGLDVVFHAFERGQDVIDRSNLRPHLAETPCVLIQEQKEGVKAAPILKTLPKVQDKASVVEAVKALRGKK